MYDKSAYDKLVNMLFFQSVDNPIAGVTIQTIKSNDAMKVTPIEVDFKSNSKSLYQESTFILSVDLLVV